MKMTLEEAKYCLSESGRGCLTCKFQSQTEIDCRGTAVEIGAAAINYLLVGQKLALEAEEKNR